MHTGRRIYLSPPQLTGKEQQYVTEALDSNWVAPLGPFVDRLEQALAAHAGVGYALATSSGTAAIHLALLALGVTKGDEVICSTLTFIGSANPIFYCGATPVFIDSERDTWNMDPDLLQQAIEDRKVKTGRLPKAIVVVHLYGMPAQMDKIMSVARAYGIPVVEDAAEAVGSFYHNRPAGSLGDIGIYSFNGNKIITSSGGGALLTNNSEWAARARYLANQAREDVPHFEHGEIGYNYRLSNISAAIGLAQLESLNEKVLTRRKVFDNYLNILPGSTYQHELPGMSSNRWLSAFCFKNPSLRDRLSKVLNENNMEARPVWKPLHLQEPLKKFPVWNNDVASSLFENGICLPSGSEADAAAVCSLISGSEFIPVVQS